MPFVSGWLRKVAFVGLVSLFENRSQFVLLGLAGDDCGKQGRGYGRDGESTR